MTPLVVALSFLLFFLASSRVYAAENLLPNSSFEDVEGNLPTSWLKNYSTLTVFATSEASLVKDGSRSVVLESQTNSLKYLYTALPVNSAGSYELSGFTKLLSGSAKLFLRLSEYGSADGTGSEIRSSDSSGISSSGDWAQLKIPLSLSHSTKSVKVKLVFDPDSGAFTQGIFDQVSWVATKNPSTSDLIDFALPSKVVSLEEFSVPVTLANAIPNTSYYLKTLGGSVDKPSSMYSVSTLNSSWIPWNGSWSSLPSVTTNANGQATTTIKSRFTSVDQETAMYFAVRIRREGTEVNLDSRTKSLTVSPPSNPPSTEAKENTNLQDEASLESSEFSSTAEDAVNSPPPPVSLNLDDPSASTSLETILGTSSSVPKTKSVAKKNNSAIPSVPGSHYLGLALGTSGFTLIIGSLFYLFRARILLAIRCLLNHEA